MDHRSKIVQQMAHQRATVNLVIEMQDLKDKLGRTKSKFQHQEFCLKRMRTENSRMRQRIQELEKAKSVDNKAQENLKVQLLQADQRVKSLTAVFRFSVQHEEAAALRSKAKKSRETIVLDK